MVLYPYTLLNNFSEVEVDSCGDLCFTHADKTESAIRDAVSTILYVVGIKEFVSIIKKHLFF